MTKLFVCALCECTSAGTQVRRRNSQSKICTWCEGELARTGRKFCTTCHKALPCDAFAKEQSRCRACKSAERKAYHEANRERLNAGRRARYAADPELSRERRKARYAQSRDQELAYRRAYYRTHHASELARARVRHAAQREYDIAYARAYRRQNTDKVRAYGVRWRVRRKLAILRGLSR